MTGERRLSWITGVGLTPFGRLEGLGTLDLMSQAADAALSDAGLSCAEIDGLASNSAAPRGSRW